MDVKEKMVKKLEKMADYVVEDAICGLLYGETEIPQSLKQECLNHQEEK